jgi:hypothetical protein
MQSSGSGTFPLIFALGKGSCRLRILSTEDRLLPYVFQFGKTAFSKEQAVNQP